MEKLLDGKKVATQLKENIRSEVSFLRERKGITPHLVVIIVGEDAASQTYVRNKHRACEEVGIRSTILTLPETIDQEELISKIKELNHQADVTGILVQLPLPKHINAQVITQTIDPAKDVDGFHPYNVGLLNLGLNTLTPCTPMGIMTIFDSYQIDLTGKHVVIIGRSDIVGKPMAQLCLAKHATVTICHSRTKELSAITQQADILIVAVGKPHFVSADMIKEGAIVIDVGINRLDNGKLAGDVQTEAVMDKVSAITPVPGGVGPMTIATLLSNTLKCMHLQR